MAITCFQKQKNLIRNYIADFDRAPLSEREKILRHYTIKDYLWRGMHPFNEQKGCTAPVKTFWKPFLTCFTACQRRMDFFFAGQNDCDKSQSIWTLNAGHFMGLFDQNWLGIPSTGKIALLPYAEFHRIVENKITETALFCDILSIMDQAGIYPLPPMTGAHFIYPGPYTHSGLLFDPSPAQQGIETLNLVNRMVTSLSELNQTEQDHCPPEVLAQTWHDDMVWYGPSGIGASYTIKRYQTQHQYPFRKNLTHKVFNGHIARFAEGHYCGFFGWPNLNNMNKGGFMGLPRNSDHAPMRVVDIYRRAGDKLAENWVYIDLLYYLYNQGLDVLARSAEINRTDYPYR